MLGCLRQEANTLALCLHMRGSAMTIKEKQKLRIGRNSE